MVSAAAQALLAAGWLQACEPPSAVAVTSPDASSPRKRNSHP